jgi:hypothetical protein
MLTYVAQLYTHDDRRIEQRFESLDALLQNISESVVRYDAIYIYNSASNHAIGVIMPQGILAYSAEDDATRCIGGMPSSRH